jgi:DNA invertase Pin-like site-specific DNA recombinase
MTKYDPEYRRIGYARVSTVGQTLEAQVEQLEAAGCEVIYQEKVTGTRADRKELMRLLKDLGPGDQLVVTRIDRLARSVFDLFSIVKRIIDAKAHFLSLAQPMADTTSSHGRLFLAVLGGVAEVEREMILTRTAEGRARSKKKMGRPPKLTSNQRAEALESMANGEPCSDIARSYNVSHLTISRLQP